MIPAQVHYKYFGVSHCFNLREGSRITIWLQHRSTLVYLAQSPLTLENLMVVGVLVANTNRVIVRVGVGDNLDGRNLPVGLADYSPHILRKAYPELIFDPRTAYLPAGGVERMNPEDFSHIYQVISGEIRDPNGRLCEPIFGAVSYCPQNGDLYNISQYRVSLYSTANEGITDVKIAF